MASRTFTFTSNTAWTFTGSLLSGGGSGSCTASFSAWGAGGHGNSNGVGGSGGGYAGTDVNDGFLVQTGSVITIVVGSASAADGQASSVITGSSPHIVRAAGGKMDGTIDHQAALQTGSYTYVGGLGGENFTGYDNYAGGGGGSRADASADGVAGQSGLFAAREAGAPGGKVPNAMPFYGGSGSYYYAGANKNGIVAGGTGDMGCGGGGGYEYPAGGNSSGAGGNGYVTVTLYD